RGAEPAGDPERAGGIVREEPSHLALRDDRLHGARERESEDERPQDLPEHPEGEAQRVAELRDEVDRDHALIVWRVLQGGPSQRKHAPEAQWTMSTSRCDFLDTSPLTLIPSARSTIERSCVPRTTRSASTLSATSRMTSAGSPCPSSSVGVMPCASSSVRAAAS